MKPLLIGLVVMLGSGTALGAGLGEECEVASDCAEGLACEVIGGVDCACPAGPDGSADDCEACTPVEERACVPGPCSDDGDCGDGFVCATFEVPCAGSTPSCDPDSSCEPREEEPCEEETLSVCAPRWVLPCADDAACGDGFTCVAEEICTCSGGGSDDPRGEEPDGSGDEFAPPPEDDCACEPGDTKWCKPDEITCDADAQCPDGWSCGHGDTASTPCALPEDGSGEPNCMPREEEEPGPGRCEPPGGAYGGDSRDLGEELGIPTNAEFDDGASTDPDGPTNGAVTDPATGCGASGGALGLMLALAGLALAFRRRVA